MSSPSPPRTTGVTSRAPSRSYPRTCSTIPSGANRRRRILRSRTELIALASAAECRIPLIRETHPAHQPPGRPALTAAGRPDLARSVRARVPGQGQSERQGRLRQPAWKLDRRRLLFVRGERQRLSLLRSEGGQRVGRRRIEPDAAVFGQQRSHKRRRNPTPIKGAPITSLFGLRFHPILHILRLHAGIDFGASVGSLVRAAADGKVEIAGPVSGFKNDIRIQHAGSRPPIRTSPKSPP